jgi:hypothetical protein
MRRPWTGVLAVAVAAIALAALVEALVDRRGNEARGDETATGARPLPACGRNQLALVLEELGGSTAVALRHVQGPPCHRSPLVLRAAVVDSRGKSSRLPLGDARRLGGDFTPGFEQLAILSSCGDAPLPSTIEASAGPYSIRGKGEFGTGTGCESIQYERTVDLGARPGTRRFVVLPLDTRTHEVSFAIDLPRASRVHVTIRTKGGPDLTVLAPAGREDCRRVGGRASCLVRFGLLGKRFFEPWTVVVRKTSPGRAHISFAIAFVAMGA